MKEATLGVAERSWHNSGLNTSFHLGLSQERGHEEPFETLRLSSFHDQPAALALTTSY